MTWFLYLVAIAWVGIGSILILHTEKVRDVLSGIMEEANFRIWGGITLAFGILLGIASFWSGVVWFLFLLSMTIAGMGAYALFGEEAKVKSLIENWTKISDAGYRLWGLIFVITAVALLTWI